MGSRSIATTYLTIGRFRLQVKIYKSASAEDAKESFRRMSPKGNPTKQKVFDDVTGEEITDHKTFLKGYPIGKDEFVLFTQEEVSAMQAEKCEFADVVEFVPVDTINPLHVEQMYYLQPESGYDSKYHLMYRSLLKTNKAAVVNWINRGKEHLCCVQAFEHGLIMKQMYYATELRTFENKVKPIYPSDEAVSQMASIIERKSVDELDLSKFADHYPEVVQRAVEARQNGETKISVTLSRPEAAHANLEAELAATLADMEDEAPKSKPKSSPKAAPQPPKAKPEPESKLPKTQPKGKATTTSKKK
jgi:DNA end-binding protein Ku